MGEECREAFRALLTVAAEQAVVVGNLHRLYEDYQQTERRARGLEEVLIPELQADLVELEGILESQDLEEAIWRKTLLERRE